MEIQLGKASAVLSQVPFVSSDAELCSVPGEIPRRFWGLLCAKESACRESKKACQYLSATSEEEVGMVDVFVLGKQDDIHLKIS